jgi:hypothetical protein
MRRLRTIKHHDGIRATSLIEATFERGLWPSSICSVLSFSGFPNRILLLLVANLPAVVSSAITASSTAKTVKTILHEGEVESAKILQVTVNQHCQWGCYSTQRVHPTVKNDDIRFDEQKNTFFQIVVIKALFIKWFFAQNSTHADCRQWFRIVLTQQN